MKGWLPPIALALTIVSIVLAFVNASWLAPEPRGAVKLIAHRGVMQQSGRANTAGVTCTATRIEPPVHDFIENTLPALHEAYRLGAAMIEIDVAKTVDDRVVLFHDADLSCRTDGHGLVSAATLAQLQTLDAGYGYSADGGRTFPLRGKGKGLIPTLEEVLAAAPHAALLYNINSEDPVVGDLLIATLKAAGRDPMRARDGFSAPATALARIRAAWPKVWSYSDAALEACTNAYRTQGWLGFTPAVCNGGTMAIPIDRAWQFAGWPNRLIARMEAVGAHVILIGPTGNHGPMGLDLPEQIAGVPATFNGYVWVDDTWTVAPALHLGRDFRMQDR